MDELLSLPLLRARISVAAGELLPEETAGELRDGELVFGAFSGVSALLLGLCLLGRSSGSSFLGKRSQ